MRFMIVGTLAISTMLALVACAGGESREECRARLKAEGYNTTAAYNRCQVQYMRTGPMVNYH